jgi:hypothetical protein
MQHRQLQLGHGFRVVLGDGHSQAAQLSRASGETVVNGETVPL